MKKWMFILMTFTMVLVLGACGNDAKDSIKKDQVVNSTADDTADSLKSLESGTTSGYLADSKGMTLYYFKKDESGKSNCAGECLENWPPFMAKDFNVPKGFDKKDFGIIKREDTGTEQVTYKGFPLYYFVKDKQVGDVNGEGVKDVWYIVNNETVFPK
ncbi:MULTISPECIES: hypothetical protein [unclassified Peribacillus]|uniref:COG4315 family predicted lipoprotein n=1 Tax=unclassified Peribacillus TaxID=2675266 RepID=UPI001913770A|nr:MULTISPECIES: hypothetical protein [unclassified Peribacillus]MBK5443494.1 hypothetical protein [Peribacillus sp. TH24]MBK5461772.1 hypothetical protein [Peribacillus sp. TH27]WMX58995.1 hypothetical protein RE409_30565 [Peribacillus sp. R9-11]